MKQTVKKIICIFSMLTLLLPMVLLSAQASSNTLLDGQVTIESSYDTGISINGSFSDSVSGNSYSATVKSGSYEVTATITVTNTSGSKATIAFDYSASTSNTTFTLGGETKTGSGSYSGLLEVGGSVTMTLKAKNNWGSKTATLSLSNIACTVAAETNDVTFQFDGALGGVSVDNVAITDGTVKTGIELGSSLALVASPNSGTTFLAWIDPSTGSVYSTDASYTLTPANDMTIKAVFVNEASDAHFWVNGKGYLFGELSIAVATAVTMSNKTVSLAYHGTLPAGDYTIPSGVTLLIPCDSANTVYTTAPGNDGSDTYTAPTIYRTLTMAEGANITVNGSISLGGKIGTWLGNSTNGAPSGPLGHIKMNSGSKITVNSGANLYAWGYITGSGSVEIMNGGSVYEDFQIRDWRGGSVTSDMVENEQKVFPLSQFYIQNIEVPLKLNAGSKEMVSTAVSITLVGVQNPCPEFIGSGGLFVIESGYLIKDYDESTGRSIITLNGNLSLSNLAITMKVSVLANVTLNSQDYVLPFSSHYTVNIEGGTVNVNQDIAFLPGAELSIASGANVVMASGYSMYIYDADDWGKFCYYQGGGGVDATYAPLLWAPAGVKAQSAFVNTDAKVLVNGTLDASEGGIYTTAGGANIYSTGTGTVKTGETASATTYQYSQISDDDGYGTEVYIDIAVTSAQLKHENGEYLSTGTSTTYNHAHYTCEHDSTGTAELHGKWFAGVHTNSSVVTDPTCTEKGFTTYTCACGHSYTGDEVEAGHTPNDDDGDCTTAITCSVCGTETTAANAEHTWNEGEITTEATETTTGIMTYTCMVDGCNKTYTEEIPATGSGGGEETYYSVTISWGDMCFEYVPEYTWQTDTLSYAVTGGSWNPSSEGSGNIVISNAETSPGKVSAAATFAPESDLGWEPGAVWTMLTRQVSTVDQVTLDAGATATINYAPSGSPLVDGNIALSDTASVIGTITVTLEKGG